MKLFGKTFFSLLICCVAIIISTSYVVSVKQIQEAKKNVVHEQAILASLMAKEVEVGYFESKWPFESLKTFSGNSSFFFWWVVKDDGTIHLADDVSFIGTHARDYFPQLADIRKKESVSPGHDESYSIFVQQLDTGEKKWSFWYGFNMKEVSKKKQQVVLLLSIVSLSTIIALGFVLYFTIKLLTRPVSELAAAATKIGKGELTHKVKIHSKDELGQLAMVFNEMAEALERNESHRKRAEDALREKDAIFQAFLEHSPVYVFFKDHHLRATQLSRNYEEMLGRPLEEILGRTMDELFPPDIAKSIIEDDEKILAEGQVIHVDEEIGGRSYTTIKFPINLEGRPPMLAGFAIDVTDRKHVEVALRESEERYRSVVEDQTEVICRVDPEGTLSFVNDVFCRFFGKEKKTLIGKKWQPLTMAGDVPEIDEKLKTLSPANPVVTIENRVYSASGEIRYMQFANRGFFDAQGRLVEIQAVGRDITEQKQAEGALRESERSLQAYLDASPVAISLVDMEGKRKYINRKFHELFGYTLEDIPTVAEFRRRAYPDPDYRAAIPTGWISELKAGKELRPYEATITCKDGYQRHVIASAAAVSDTILLMLDDITERKHLESELQQSQKMEAIGHLAGGIAHDFNNILTAIIGFGTVTQMDLDIDSPHRVHIDDILRAAQRATRLTSSLLAYSRKQIIQPVLLNLNDSLEYQKNLLWKLAGDDIQFVTKLSKQSLTVRIDPGQVDQVVMNIVTNARDAMPQGGTITMETKLAKMDDAFVASHGYGTPGAYALLAISDTGVGMDEKVLQNIFNPFFTTKEVGKGTGLGLSVVYGIVKQNNGYVDVKSVPGQGTTFYVYLPQCHQEPPTEQEEVPQLTQGHETILVAEDDDSVRPLIRTILEKAGYTVIEAQDGVEGLRIFEEQLQTIDLVLLDVVMPGKNGKEIYERIRRIKPDQKVVFNSGYAEDMIAAKGILEDGLAFISKPMNPVDLLKRIDCLTLDS